MLEDEQNVWDNLNCFTWIKVEPSLSFFFIPINYCWILHVMLCMCTYASAFCYCNNICHFILIFFSWVVCCRNFYSLTQQSTQKTTFNRNVSPYADYNNFSLLILFSIQWNELNRAQISLEFLTSKKRRPQIISS